MPADETHRSAWAGSTALPGDLPDPDPVARLILQEAPAEFGCTLVLDDRCGVISSHLLGRGVDLRAWCDDLRDERHLPIAPLAEFGPDGLNGVETVLLRLPKSLGALEDYVQRVAAWAAPRVRIVAGGREKHLTRAMNDVLGSRFATVRASHGRHKSRVLHASGSRPGPLTWPHTTRLAEFGLVVVSHGGVFAADRLDGGTRLLLHALAGGLGPDPVRAVDLGCGSGLIASWLAARGHDVLAVDVSWAACRSTMATAAANTVEVRVQRSDGLAGAVEGSAELVVCNPPFHRGTAKDSTPGFDLLASALPAMPVGGTLWTVFNSHLPYLPFLRTEAGPTRVVARDRRYTVTRTVRA